MFNLKLPQILHPSKKSSARHPPFFNCPLEKRLFPSDLPPPILHFHKHGTNRISLLIFHLSVPVKHNKSIGLPMNRASAGAKGNSVRSGAICSGILPFSIERERLTESFRISFVHSSFQRSRSFRARLSIALICWRKKRYAATMPRMNAMAGMRSSVRGQISVGE